MIAETFQAAAQLLADYMPQDVRSMSVGVALLIVLPFVLSAVPHAINRNRKEG